MDKESAVLQGGFLLADKLCQPRSLSTIKKNDWAAVSAPILQALSELSRQEDDSSCDLNTSAIHWNKRLVCVLWCKLLCVENGEDVETSWRENPFFALQSGLPEVSRVVLLELVKSTGDSEIFGQFLLGLPQTQVCTELGRLAEHVASSPTTEEDIHLLLDVWWELWRGMRGGEDAMEEIFANQFARLSSQGCPSSSDGPSHQIAKRIKLDSSALNPAAVTLASSSATSVVTVLLHALMDIKEHLSTADICCKALSVCLDTLYTCFLIDQAVTLSAVDKLNFIARVVTIRESNHIKLSSELLQEAQRDLSASHSPSPFRSSGITLSQALKIITELTQCWQDRGLLKTSDSGNVSYSAFKLDQSIQRTRKALGNGDMTLPKTMNGADDCQSLMELKHTLRGLLESLTFPSIQSSPEVIARVTMAIIDYRLEGYADLAVLFASETSWSIHDNHWMECLERNQSAFQQHETLMKLVSTLTAKFHSDSADVSQCRRLMKIAVDIFSKLTLEDKNKSLVAILGISNKGLFGYSLPSAIADGFGQELNMAFNCIIQGGGGASAAVLQNNLNTAVSLIARVAFQNPEATLKSCCHAAVFNKGAFSLMAKILQQLPGLRAKQRQDEAQQSDEEARSLLCSCLQETITTKLLSPNEGEQLLRFLVLLMEPVIEAEGEDGRQSFLSIQEVVGDFVLPHLYTTKCGPISLELSLQLLHAAFSLDHHDAASPHWVLDCSPFPLLYTLAQLLNQAIRCWDQPLEDVGHRLSIDLKEPLVSVLTALAQAVGREVASAPGTWSRALFWLYNKAEELDWTVRFHLKPVWGEHFKNEVPSSLLAVCDLPEQEWSGLELALYGQGTGLLAWVECCSISDGLQSTMLSCLSLDRRQPEHVNMFSKGLLVAITQTLPWCSISEWTRLLRTLRTLLQSGQLHVPYSLEYVDYLPLLNLREFSCELRLSVLLLRVLQFLCGSSCSDWLPVEGWAHVGRLYGHSMREMLESVRRKLPLTSSSTSSISRKIAATSDSPKTSDPIISKSPKAVKDPPGPEDISPVELATTPQADTAVPSSSKPSGATPPEEQQENGTRTVCSQEVLFVLSQLFCHVQHAQVMMPGGQCESLFLCALEILTHYEAVIAAFPDSCSHLEMDNTRHFFSTITENLESREMKAVLQQKIAQLMISVE